MDILSNIMIKYVINYVYQAYILSDNISPALALLAEKHIDFTVLTKDLFTVDKAT